MSKRPKKVPWLDTVVFSPSMRAYRGLVNGAVFTPAQNAFRVFMDGIESHATAIANDGVLRHLPLNGQTGVYASTVSATINKITGDIEIVVLIVPQYKVPGAAQVILSKGTQTGNNLSYGVQINGGTGNISLIWSTAGVSWDQNFGAAASDVPLVPGVPIFLKFTLDVNNGIGGYTADVYWAPFTGTVTEPTSWITAAHTATTSGTTNIADSTAPLIISGYSLAASNPFAGKAIRAIVRSGIGGTVAADFNPNTDATDGATSFTSTNGEAWTLNGTNAAAAENGTPTIVLNKVMDLLIRARIQETAARAGATTDDYQFQHDLSGTYVNIAGSGAGVIFRDSPTLLDSDINTSTLTTQRLSAGTGSYVAGEITEDGLVTDRQLTASNFMELLLSVRLDPAFFPLGTTTLHLRTLVNNTIMPYNQVITLTIVKNAVVLEPTTGALALASGGVPTLKLTLTPSTAALALGGLAPSVNVGTNLTPGTANLTLASGGAPILTTTLTPATASLALSGFAPILKTTLTPSTASVVITGYAPAVSVVTVVTPATASLALASGGAPVLQTIVTPATAALLLAGFAPILTTTLTPSTAAVLLTTYAPTISVATVLTPDPASLVISSGGIPTLKTTLTPATAPLVLTSFEPTVDITRIIVPDAAGIVLTGYAPTLLETLTPDTATLAITGAAPAVCVTQVIVPDPAELQLTGYAPFVQELTAGTIIPLPAELAISGFAPVVTVTDNVTVTPAPAVLVLGSAAPLVAIIEGKQPVGRPAQRAAAILYVPDPDAPPQVASAPDLVPLPPTPDFKPRGEPVARPRVIVARMDLTQAVPEPLPALRPLPSSYMQPLAPGPEASAPDLDAEEIADLIGFLPL